MRSKINHRALRILYEIVVLAAAVCLLWNGLFLLGCSLMPERTTYGQRASLFRSLHRSLISPE